tara:strand:- start:17932 stop:18642 length:711 start_codon:yes stop_codon:yes gene_type:complete
MNIIESFVHGLQLGGITMLISSIMDNTISYKETLNLTNKNGNLYIESLHSNYINLLIIGPIYYIIVYNYFLDNQKIGFNSIDYIEIVFIHNILYYLAHFGMHKVSFLKFMHEFHHLFKDTIPSTGNAVSVCEFNFAYILPFVIASLIVVPNNVTLKCSVGTISILNTFIHTPNFDSVLYHPVLVSPSNHMKHHKDKSGNYAAPLINIDYLIKEFWINFNYYKEITKLKIDYFLKNE